MEVQEKTTSIRNFRSFKFAVTALVWTCLFVTLHNTPCQYKSWHFLCRLCVWWTSSCLFRPRNSQFSFVGTLRPVLPSYPTCIQTPSLSHKCLRSGLGTTVFYNSTLKKSLMSCLLEGMEGVLRPDERRPPEAAPWKGTRLHMMKGRQTKSVKCLFKCNYSCTTPALHKTNSLNSHKLQEVPRQL